MSAEKETLQRVQGGLFHLQKGLTPFVEARMKTEAWGGLAAFASRASGGDPERAARCLWPLKTMIDRWREVFDDAFAAARQAQGAQLHLDGAGSAQRDLASGARRCKTTRRCAISTPCTSC